MPDDDKVDTVLRLLAAIAANLQGINTNLRTIARRLEEPLPENVTDINRFLTGGPR